MRSLLPPIGPAVDRVIRRVEATPSLDKVGRALTNAFARLVRPGALKDALSGTWLGNPLHPLLTDVPIGAWTNAFVLDVMGGPSAERASDALVGLGVLAALPTAVTGLSDLSDVSDRDQRTVGATHALGNSLALTLYAASYVQRRRGRRRSGRALSFAGMAVATASAHLGGHLVYRLQVGPDQARPLGRVRRWTPVLDEAALTEGKPMLVTAGIDQVMVVRSQGRIYAMANRCSHRGGPLYKGTLEDGCVTCPWHRSTFRLEDGSIVRGPAVAPQTVYEVRVESGKVEIRSA
jgi:nitrite reductase/ring-hydroxylating ferredoxin subunit/uncharacterized membrane protein